MTYVEVGETRTWYAEHGSGEPLVYLHGGWSDARELDETLPEYSERFRVFTPERRGHGRTPDVPGPFSFAGFADDVVAFLESVVGGPAHVVGHSDGATVALQVALRRPDLVRRLVCISGLFHHDGLPPGSLDDVSGLADSPLATAYGELSPDGIGHFPVVLEKLAATCRADPTLTVADLAGVRARTLVMSGDDDIVSLEHTVALYRALPDAELAVVPGTSHVLYAEKPRAVTAAVLEFLTTDPVPTLVPIRRAG